MRRLGFVLFGQSWGGLEINVLKLANSFASRGWEVYLFTQVNSRISQEIHHPDLKVYFMKEHRKYFAIKNAFYFSRILKKLNIRDLWLFENRDLDFGFITKVFYRNIRIVYQQQMQIGVPKRDWIHTLRYNSIDHWITLTEILKKELKDKTKISISKVITIPLGAEVEKFSTPKYSKEEARLKLGIPQNVMLLGILGRIDPLKGQYFLLEAVSKLSEKFPSLQLLIMGDKTSNSIPSEEYFVKIQRFIQENHLSDIIHLRSFTKDVHVFYDAIDIFAMASEAETFGMVTIEAMISSIPVIGTNSASTPEILKYGELGKLYKWDDIQELCESLTWIIQHPDESKRMAELAKISAINKYSFESECDRMENEILNIYS